VGRPVEPPSDEHLHATPSQGWSQPPATLRRA
jgi:hypothetical protein